MVTRWGQCWKSRSGEEQDGGVAEKGWWREGPRRGVEVRGLGGQNWHSRTGETGEEYTVEKAEAVGGRGRQKYAGSRKQGQGWSGRVRRTGGGGRVKWGGAGGGRGVARRRAVRFQGFRCLQRQLRVITVFHVRTHACAYTCLCVHMLVRTHA